jgi:hypothetical protein|tara:strand:- start:450 stop:632 length:183 start_codon:yes stop_codon:yes gene_type:complete
MATYKVTFAPHDTTKYVYEVEVDDPNNAEFVGWDEFRFDIGYDKSKDFELVSVEEVKDDG